MVSEDSFFVAKDEETGEYTVVGEDSFTVVYRTFNYTRAVNTCADLNRNPKLVTRLAISEASTERNKSTIVEALVDTGED